MNPGHPPGQDPTEGSGSVPITPGYGPPPAQPGPPYGYPQAPPPQGYPAQGGYPPAQYGYPPHGGQQGYPPPTGQAPYGYGPPAPVAPVKKKGGAGRVILIIAGVIVLLCLGGIVIAIATSGGGTSSSSRTGGSGGSGGGGGNAPVGLNQPGRDGKFEFVVQKVECGISSIGDSVVGKKAQGQFCEVHLTVKNIGDKAQLFDSSSQHAYNAAGQKYDADGEAGIYLGDSGNAFLNNINPGNTVTGIVVFDIPAGQKITKLELHDSPFSGGVTVNNS
jgi:hypothetical protein